MTEAQKGRIFISYRRADSQFAAGRIYDRLVAHFGEEAIFMDVEAIDGGVDFVHVLEGAVQSCDVVLVVIGKTWLNIKDERGERRLDNPDDFVRIEIAVALSREIRVIPVLVEHAIMPRSTALPENLKPLARRNALQVNHQSFNADANRLISHIERAIKAVEDSRVMKAQAVRAERERALRHNQITKLLTQADTAINMQDWALAQQKLKDILALDDSQLDAQAKLELVEEKLTVLEKIKRVENREKEEARKRRAQQVETESARVRAERLAREKRAAEEKEKQAALRKERQQERAENVKKFFSKYAKGLLFGFGGIALLFLLGYMVSNIEPPAEPISTKVPITQVLPTATLVLPTSTLTPTEIPVTPTPTLGVGSTLVSEKDGMTMVYVPAGEFQMGSENGSPDESPVHAVYLDAYWIDQTEVTNAMYTQFLNENGNQEEGGVTWLDAGDNDVRIRQSGDTWQVNSGYENHPAVEVSWYGAQAYCNWAGGSLPTEAQWEKAASWDENVNSQRIYPWGSEIDDTYANYNQNVGDTTAVGIYASGKSFYGAYDMAGNVWEWVSDWYASDYYANSPASNPQGPESGSSRVLRGGSWYVTVDDLRVSNRYDRYPGSRNNDLGFRCSR